MPSEIFKRVDSRHIAAALANNTTHDGIGTFELSLGIATTGNKGERANQVVRYIYEQSDTDRLIVELLNYLYVENTYADTSEQNEYYTRLRTNVLEPRGVVLTDNGFTLSDGRDIDQLERVTQPQVATQTTSAEITELFSNIAGRHAPVATTSSIDSSRVFVVHGRDMRPVEVVRQYLLFLGLRVMAWSEAVALTRIPQPHTYDVVKAGINHAAAVIVIFSPDDMARVKDDFSQTGDPDRTPQGQARQNVILEAGMAFASAPSRTVFVKSEPTRDISDIDGFNWVKLDGQWDSRADLKGRLQLAGAAVIDGNHNLADPLAGPFMIQP